MTNPLLRCFNRYFRVNAGICTVTANMLESSGTRIAGKITRNFARLKDMLFTSLCGPFLQCYYSRVCAMWTVYTTCSGKSVSVVDCCDLYSSHCWLYNLRAPSSTVRDCWSALHRVCQLCCQSSVYPIDVTFKKKFCFVCTPASPLGP